MLSATVSCRLVLGVVRVERLTRVDRRQRTSSRTMTRPTSRRHRCSVSFALDVTAHEQVASPSFHPQLRPSLRSTSSSCPESSSRVNLRLGLGSSGARKLTRDTVPCSPDSRRDHGPATASLRRLLRSQTPLVCAGARSRPDWNSDSSCILSLHVIHPRTGTTPKLSLSHSPHVFMSHASVALPLSLSLW